MDTLTLLWNNALAFIFVISTIVFVHEMGHFGVARYYGIGVKIFSIGFGPEIFGYTGEKSGTRYRLSLLPLGGYVAMYGEETHQSHENNPEFSFAARPAYARGLVVFAGPLANFIFGFLLISAFFLIQGVDGEKINGVSIGNVSTQSPAERSGLQSGDIITHIDGKKLRAFIELAETVRQSKGRLMELTVMRDAEKLRLSITPDFQEFTNNGNISQKFYIGVTDAPVQKFTVNPVQAMIIGADQLLWITQTNLKAIGEMIIGKRSPQDLGGPVRIAVISHNFAQNGFWSLMLFMALLSVNLGLINLFPIPVLDGGHLVFIFYEMLTGKALPLQIKERMLQIGLALIIMLIIFVTTNDIISLNQK